MTFAQPSKGGPRYTIDTSVLPYTADTEGYKRLSGNPAKKKRHFREKKEAKNVK